MTKSANRPQRPRRAPVQTIKRTAHVYPPGRRYDDWLVPFVDNHACMHHDHNRAPDDHSGCGPSVFCCLKAAALYKDLFPDSDEAVAQWELTEAAHIAGWMRPSERGPGVLVIWFCFCDPDRADGLLVVGLPADEARSVLFRRVPLERYADESQRLC
ncbi:MAG: hypothetical protein JXM73_10540 [Anaerolineae bacterium]|nr:hypothetical protein [Anaerolineae bacterium]